MIIDSARRAHGLAGDAYNDDWAQIRASAQKSSGHCGFIPDTHCVIVQHDGFVFSIDALRFFYENRTPIFLNFGDFSAGAAWRQCRRRPL
jgi:hypothetical protein